ncbi:MAG: ABC transporter permease [Tannerella sp.]|jgi:putative ABC transport system permease protein|nr:ABC transporter permease [Tannerella sp.]
MKWQRVRKSWPLRAVNLLGLAIIFASLLLSYTYIRRECSYDRFHVKADRILRLSYQYGATPVDGRFMGLTKQAPLLHVPGISDAVLMTHIQTGVLRHDGKPYVLHDFYAATASFFKIFSFHLIAGDTASVLDAPGKAAISRHYAQMLFGGVEKALGQTLEISSRRFPEMKVNVSGVFENFPETSHFHTDLVFQRADDAAGEWTYVYLLKNPETKNGQLAKAITGVMNRENTGPEKVRAILMPITDIHLHGRTQRELEPNGNISYIYLVAGANVLLLAIVLFNLWLNSGLIFAYNRRYYQLLRLNGAQASTVLRDEGLLSLLLGIAALLLGGGLAWYLFPRLHLAAALPGTAALLIFCLVFLLLVSGISLLPVLRKMSSTLFRNSEGDLKPSRFSLSNVRFMLIAQYALVMFIVILAFGIGRQMGLVRSTQMGAGDADVLVMPEQPDPVKEKFALLKSEWLRYPEIKAVTSAMQLPGSAIRDYGQFLVEGRADADKQNIPLLAVGDDFFPFFHLKMLAGRPFRHLSRSLSEETALAADYYKHKQPYVPDATEEYVINRKAAAQLGFASPEAAVGKQMQSFHDYIGKGTIVGVCEDFNYTNTYDEGLPLVIKERQMYQNCFFVRFAPGERAKGMAAFQKVWKEVNPDYPADYSFLPETYARVYHNERMAESLVDLFSLLSLVVANLGLIIIMAFLVGRKTREIGIRKVNGAAPADIFRLLNGKLAAWIGLAFVLAAPLAWWALTRWLGNFAEKAPLHWWVFVSAGLAVLAVSAIAVGWQSWRASRLNPVNALKTE